MENKPKSDLVSIGLRIREIRKQRGLSLAELASRTGLSKGLLSKIENFRAIPSLPVLVAIARSLRADLAEMVSGVGLDSDCPYLLIRAGEGARVERDGAKGFAYEALFSHEITGGLLDAFLLTIDPGAKRKRVSTNGRQLIYVLQGAIEFVLGGEILTLQIGDALFFDGRTPHVPRNPRARRARLLALYFLENDQRKTK